MKASFAEVKRIFAAVIELEGEERDRYLEDACGTDAALRERVASLLAADEAADARLPEPVPIPDSPIEVPSASESFPPIGDFRIRELLAEGGMGVVYRAEQDHPRREVALKVVKGLLSPAVRGRFHREARLLGRLRHPGIAQILAAGTAPAEHGSGEIPYFAMELVQGPTITRHAREQALSIRDRVRLIADVADAVAHAHAKGVIHRDLKPANILVGPDGRPKILDFGIARTVEEDEEAAYTRPGQVIGTPPYMSPEQCNGDVGSIDVRTDVYSLGVVAYEVLAGRAPFRGESSLTEAVRQIRYREPTRLCAVDRRLRGDLDAIVTKATAKDPARRYGTAVELVEDLRRFLARRPVAAVPPSTAYRLRKWLARDPLVAGSAAAFVIVVAVSLVAITSLYLAADRARFRSDLEAERARLTFDYFADMLSTIRPSNFPRGVPFETVLDRTTGEVSDRFEDLPELEARIRGLIGSIYLGLGRDEDAEAHLRAALSRAEEAAKGDASNADVLDARARMAELYRHLGGPLRAEAEFREVARGRALALGDEHPDTLGARAKLASYLQSISHPEGMARLRAAHAEHVRVLGSEDPRTARVARTLGWFTHHAEGKTAEAEPLVLSALAVLEARLGEDHPDTIACHETLAYVARAAGRVEASNESLARVVDFRRKVFGPDHPLTLQTSFNRAVLLADGANGAEDPARDRGIALMRETLRRMADAAGTVRRERILYGLRQLDALLDAAGRAELRAEWADRLDERAFEGPVVVSRQRLPFPAGGTGGHESDPADIELVAAELARAEFGCEIAMSDGRAFVACRESGNLFEVDGGAWTYVGSWNTALAEGESWIGVTNYGTGFAVALSAEDRGADGDPGWRRRVLVVEPVDGEWRAVAEIPIEGLGRRHRFDVAGDGERLAIAISGGDGEDAEVRMLVRREDGFAVEAVLRTFETVEAPRFGECMDLRGDLLVVGAPDCGGEGRAVVFRHSGGRWVEEAVLVPDRDPADGGSEGLAFGTSVATDGRLVVVGAPRDPVGGARRRGSAIVYAREPSGGWTRPTRIVAPDGSAGDLFGISVDVADGIVVVVAAQDDHVGLDAGSAYVFRRSTDGAWGDPLKLLPGSNEWITGVCRVAIDAGRVLLGATRDYDPSGRVRTGAVHAFDLDFDGPSSDG